MRRLGYASLIFLATLFSATLLPLQQTARAQGAQPAALVIDGGTLIDGNGGPPVRDVQVVVEGNKITRIGRKGQATPAGSREPFRRHASSRSLRKGAGARSSTP